MTGMPMPSTTPGHAIHTMDMTNIASVAVATKSVKIGILEERVKKNTIHNIHSKAATVFSVNAAGTRERSSSLTRNVRVLRLENKVINVMVTRHPIPDAALDTIR